MYQPDQSLTPFNRFYRAGCNADAVLWWDFCPSVCLSVCLSVTRVNCDKTVERSVQIYTPYERTFIVVFWEDRMVGGGQPLLREILGIDCSWLVHRSVIVRTPLLMYFGRRTPFHSKFILTIKFVLQIAVSSHTLSGGLLKSDELQLTNSVSCWNFWPWRSVDNQFWFRLL